MNTYEAMFVMDSGVASDWQLVEGEIQRLTDRAEAELLCCRRWDERRLAYDIGSHKRGCYVLTYFRADPSRITGLERDAQLSENVLRMLVLRADHVTEEEIRTHAQAGAEQKAVTRDDAGAQAAADSNQDKPTTAEPESTGTDKQVTVAEQKGEPSATVTADDLQAPAASPPSEETPTAEQPADDQSSAGSDASSQEKTELP